MFFLRFQLTGDSEVVGVRQHVLYQPRPLPADDTDLLATHHVDDLRVIRQVDAWTSLRTWYASLETQLLT